MLTAIFIILVLMLLTHWYLVWQLREDGKDNPSRPKKVVKLTVHKSAPPASLVKKEEPILKVKPIEEPVVRKPKVPDDDDDFNPITV